jgi:hypothetical protein
MLMVVGSSGPVELHRSHTLLALVVFGVLYGIPAALIAAGAARPLPAWLPAWPRWRDVDVPADRQAATASLLVTRRRARAAGALVGLFAVPLAATLPVRLGFLNPLSATLLGYATAAFIVEIWRMRREPSTAAATIEVRNTARYLPRWVRAAQRALGVLTTVGAVVALVHQPSDRGAQSLLLAGIVVWAAAEAAERAIARSRQPFVSDGDAALDDALRNSSALACAAAAIVVIANLTTIALAHLETAFAITGNPKRAVSTLVGFVLLGSWPLFRAITHSAPPPARVGGRAQP